jgi:hypothetical protein
MVSGFKKEVTYDAGVTPMNATTSFGLEDFPETALPQWDDTVADNATLVSHTELANHQEIVQQSVRFPFQEDRAKPNTLAFLLGMVMGNAIEVVQDGTFTAYRHKFVPSGSLALPSVEVQDQRDNGAQYAYTGMLVNNVTLQGNGPFWQIQAEMIGSGSRNAAADPMIGPIQENWLLWGDANIFLVDTGGTPTTPGTPITVPTTPLQGTMNLTGGQDISSILHVVNFTWNNQLQAPLGYRPGKHKLRQKFYPSRRTAQIEIEFDIDSTQDATQLAWYLNQKQLALEVQVNSLHLIATGGIYNYGATILIPRVQLRAPTGNQRGEIETRRYIGTIMDDKTNPPVIVWVYTAQAAYLS